MYNNPYYNYNQQPTIDVINNQMQELEKMKTQLQQRQQQPMQPITQNFQLAPNNNSIIKYANSIDDVNKELVIAETPFFKKDMTVMWLKNAKGEIKSYKLDEIIEKDEKDIMIENLQKQIDELKGKIDNESINDDATDEKSESVSISKQRNAKQKQSY